VRRAVLGWSLCALALASGMLTAGLAAANRARGDELDRLERWCEAQSRRNELARLANWAGTTRDGSLSDLEIEPDPKVWTQVCSEAHVCTAKTCGQNSNCFFQQARKRLLAADVVVLNHTLLFMLLGEPIEQEERLREKTANR
jgi:Rad3-related DNA helicase